MIFGSKRTAKMELAMDKKRENKEKDGEKAQILTMELQKKVTKSFYYDVTSSF